MVSIIYSDSSSGQTAAVVVFVAANTVKDDTLSVLGKLRRESVRLTQIQDIAGCRLVVSGIAEQNHVVRRLCDFFRNPRVIDRRAVPTHGYRAVHVIPVRHV